jgi:hypothetical protein
VVKLRVVGAAPGAETHDAIVVLHSVPRKDDSLSVSVANGNHVYVEIDLVVWPTWGDGEDPEVYLRRDEQMSDEEWAEVFVAIQERRSP